MKDIYTVPQIRKITNHHMITQHKRKWIHHRFNEKGGIDGIMPKKHSHKQYKFDDIERKRLLI